MKINLTFRNFIILISIIAFLKGSLSITSASRDKDFKDKYGVQLVLAR